MVLLFLYRVTPKMCSSFLQMVDTDCSPDLTGQHDTMRKILAPARDATSPESQTRLASPPTAVLSILLPHRKGQNPEKGENTCPHFPSFSSARDRI